MALSSATNTVVDSGITVGGVQIHVASGAPALASAKGSLYIRTDGSSSSTRLYVQGTAGSTTGWIDVTTSA